MPTDDSQTAGRAETSVKEDNVPRDRRAPVLWNSREPAPPPMGRRFALAIAIGVALGVVGARLLFVGSWLSLVPWGVAGFLFGVWSRLWWSATLVGAVYGFALAFSFMMAGYRGSLSVATRVAPFAVVGLVGAVGGLTTALIGAATFAIVERLRR